MKIFLKIIYILKTVFNFYQNISIFYNRKKEQKQLTNKFMAKLKMKNVELSELLLLLFKKKKKIGVIITTNVNRIRIFKILQWMMAVAIKLKQLI